MKRGNKVLTKVREGGILRAGIGVVPFFKGGSPQNNRANSGTKEPSLTTSILESGRRDETAERSKPLRGCQEEMLGIYQPRNFTGLRALLRPV